MTSHDLLLPGGMILCHVHHSSATAQTSPQVTQWDSGPSTSHNMGRTEVNLSSFMTALFRVPAALIRCAAAGRLSHSFSSLTARKVSSLHFFCDGFAAPSNDGKRSPSSRGIRLALFSSCRQPPS